MTAQNHPSRRAGFARRGLVVAAALLGMLNAAEAKILLGSESASLPPADASPTEKPPSIAPGSSAHVDYYIYGVAPTWWNQTPALAPHQLNLATLGTVSITRGLLRSAVALRLARNAERLAVVSNKSRSWLVDGTLLHGVVTPLGSFRNSAGLFCRNFAHSLTLDDGSERTVQGTACRALTGAWLLVGAKNFAESVNRSTAP